MAQIDLDSKIVQKHVFMRLHHFHNQNIFDHEI